MPLPPHQAGYRPDIDGLRAIAVLAVVVFHLNKNWLPGGFVGVDVFFVISGFLITGILSRNIAAGTFSFASFYLARARRILPASFFCIVVTLLIGAIFMLPADVKDLGASAAASVISAGNIYFWKFLDTSYFATSSEMVPLLHLWSLAVEEQFYLFWPLMLLAAFKWLPPFLRVASAVALGSASFYIGQKYLASDPSFSYYMLPARAGELMMGAAAYWLTIRTKKIYPAYAESLALAGLALIVWSVARLSESAGFPGYASIPPTLGAGMLILAGSTRKTIVGRLLSIAPMVAVGRVSFSLYLWHWPVMAFYRYAYGEPTTKGYLICAAVMTIMTLISYFGVEKPFRFGRPTSGTRSALKFTGVSIALAGIAVGAAITGGLPFFKPASYGAELAALDGTTKAASEYPFNCQIGSFDERVLTDERCVIGRKNATVKTLLWGDSHAAHYVGFFKAIGEHTGVAIRNISISGCMPLFGTSSEYTVPAIRDTCTKFNEAMELEVTKYDTVILGSAWVGFDRGNSRKDIADTVAELSKKVPHVVIALSAPLFLQYDRQCERKALMIPGMRCEEKRTQRDGPERDINAYLVELASKFPNVETFDIHNLLCEGPICRAEVQGQPAYFDAGHISMIGSERLGKEAIVQNRMPAFMTPAQRSDLLSRSGS
ncbi:acyltransferase [Achromobacter insolitus]|uniref:acyltransferase family protein n=1 Tax=Achromobacter insolitus TaxID=217204 RepID=UPI0011EB743B|nr:acyltransferase family protein [Achromobacter insolitus]QEK92701.1 acyltransferase [Achromobacter insolitus]GLK94949.1 acyltransferase [Achromobacter xylosoxidans]